MSSVVNLFLKSPSPSSPRLRPKRHSAPAHKPVRPIHINKIRNKRKFLIVAPRPELQPELLHGYRFHRLKPIPSRTPLPSPTLPARLTSHPKPAPRIRLVHVFNQRSLRVAQLPVVKRSQLLRILRRKMLPKPFLHFRQPEHGKALIHPLVVAPLVSLQKRLKLLLQPLLILLIRIRTRRRGRTLQRQSKQCQQHKKLL